MGEKELTIILGPTGAGKSDFAVDFAEKAGSPIINCDSRQIYSELNIGVARPSPEQLGRVKHYLVATHSITKPYSAGDYEREAVPLAEELFSSHDTLVMCGGSGMYIDAVCNGLDDFPDIDPSIREELSAKALAEGTHTLAAMLSELDPETYATIDKSNRQRLVRALEVTLGTGRKYSSFKSNSRKERSFRIRKIGIFREREELYGRINARVDIMVENGLIEEVRSLMPYRNLPALNTVGYRELFYAFDGEYSIEKAIELIKRNSRHYAKKQMTYWRRDPSVEWIDLSGK